MGIEIRVDLGQSGVGPPLEGVSVLGTGGVKPTPNEVGLSFSPFPHHPHP